MPGQVAIDWNKVVFNMLTIKGIYGRQMYETWYKMTAMIQSGLDISPLITHRFHYTDFQEGFEIAAVPKCRKSDTGLALNLEFYVTCFNGRPKRFFPSSSMPSAPKIV